MAGRPTIPTKERLMPEDKEFPTGLYVNRPRPGSPDFVKARISIKIETFLEYLSEQDGEWLWCDVKEGFKVDPKTDLKKWYAQVDTWTPDQKKLEEDTGDEPLPF
jgi:hypothetical protein